jgi:hypothetical protein
VCVCVCVCVCVLSVFLVCVLSVCARDGGGDACDH